MKRVNRHTHLQVIEQAGGQACDETNGKDLIGNPALGCLALNWESEACRGETLFLPKLCFPATLPASFR